MDLGRNAKAPLKEWAYTSDRGALWETKSEFWLLEAFLNFPTGFRVALLLVSQQLCYASISSYALLESVQI